MNPDTWALSVALALAGCASEESPHSAKRGDTGRSSGVAQWPSPVEMQDAVHDGKPNPWLAGLESASPDPQRESSTPPADVMEVVDVDDPDIESGEAPPDEEEPPDEESIETVVPPPLKRWFVAYEEGSGTDKSLSIAGELGMAPSDCSIKIYSNGGTEPWRTLPLPAVFPADGLVVLCSSPTLRTDCTHELSGSVFNGDDALVLFCGDEVFDSLGRRGEDPGTAWLGQALDRKLSTEGQRLLRCTDSPDPAPDDEFLLADTWINVLPGEEPAVALSYCANLLGQGGAPAVTN